MLNPSNTGTELELVSLTALEALKEREEAERAEARARREEREDRPVSAINPFRQSSIVEAEDKSAGLVTAQVDVAAAKIYLPPRDDTAEFDDGGADTAGHPAGSPSEEKFTNSTSPFPLPTKARPNNPPHKYQSLRMQQAAKRWGLPIGSLIGGAPPPPDSSPVPAPELKVNFLREKLSNAELQTRKLRNELENMTSAYNELRTHYSSMEEAMDGQRNFVLSLQVINRPGVSRAVLKTPL